MGEAGKSTKRKAEELRGGGAAMGQTGLGIAERLAGACASVAATIVATQSLHGANGA